MRTAKLKLQNEVQYEKKDKFMLCKGANDLKYLIEEHTH